MEERQAQGQLPVNARGELENRLPVGFRPSREAEAGYTRQQAVLSGVTHFSYRNLIFNFQFFYNLYCCNTRLVQVWSYLICYHLTF